MNIINIGMKIPNAIIVHLILIDYDEMQIDPYLGSDSMFSIGHGQIEVGISLVTLVQS
jgi:hypothetical protein